MRLWIPTTDSLSPVYETLASQRNDEGVERIFIHAIRHRALARTRDVGEASQRGKVTASRFVRTRNKGQCNVISKVQGLSLHKSLLSHRPSLEKNTFLPFF